MQQGARGVAAASLRSKTPRSRSSCSSSSAATSSAQFPRSAVDGIFRRSIFPTSESSLQPRRWISQLVLGGAGRGGWSAAALNGRRANWLYAVPVRLASTATSAANAGQESRKWRFSAIFLFLPCVATFGLGTWQLFRRQWKIEVLDYRRKRLQEEPIPLENAIASALEGSETVDVKSSSNETAIDELEFRTVICEGAYDEKNNLFVGPRVRSAFGVTQKGYFVITPLLLPDGRKSVQIPVLVNRGWVPSGWLEESALAKSVVLSDTAAPEVKVGRVPWWKFWIRQPNSTDNKEVVLPRKQAAVTVHGVIRGSEEPNMFVPSNVPIKGQWFYVDVPAMAHTLGLPDNTILIEAVREPQKSEGREVFPLAKDPEALLHSSVMPQDHINYALTWYSLSAATTFMAVKRVQSSRRGR